MRPHPLRSWPLLALALGLASPAGARPEQLQDPEARRLRQEGEACYRQRQYRCALERFQQAFDREPIPAMRFNIASARDKLGMAALAIREYRRYLAEAGTAAPTRAVVHIQRRMQALLQRVARLQLRLSPADLMLALDGEAIPTVASAAGPLELPLEPGKHRLELSRPGYEARAETITVAAGEVRELTLTLKPLASDQGSLSITSTPPGAEVWIDGRKLARPSPLTVPRLSAGWHQVQLVTPTHCFERHVQIPVGEEIRIDAPLEPLVGNLELRHLPAGATLLVDGAPAQVPLWLGPGEHQVTVERAGSLPWARRIVVTCLAPKHQLTVSLHGGTRLRLRSVPPAAAVTIDGKHRGSTPGIFALGPGRHQLELRAPGHLLLTRTVAITAEQLLELQLDLAPDPITAANLARRRRKNIWAISSLVLAVGSAAGMAALYGLGKSEGDSAYELYRAATLEAERDRHAEGVRAAELKIIGGHVLLGVSALSLGLSLYQFLTRPAPYVASGGRVTLSPAPGGLVLGGGF